MKDNVISHITYFFRFSDFTPGWFGESPAQDLQTKWLLGIPQNPWGKLGKISYVRNHVIYHLLRSVPSKNIEKW